MNKCENPKCGKEIVSYTGRRTKKYCSIECRNAHYLVKYPPKSKKVNTDTHKTIPIEKWNEIQEKLKQIDDTTKNVSINQNKTTVATKIEKAANDSKKEINAEIKATNEPKEETRVQRMLREAEERNILNKKNK